MSNKKQTYLSPMISVCDMNGINILADSVIDTSTGGLTPGADCAKKSIDIEGQNDENSSSENSNNNSFWYDEENN